jgi:hypothetical protein
VLSTRKYSPHQKIPNVIRIFAWISFEVKGRLITSHFRNKAGPPLAKNFSNP